ncbi:hypothetical protein NQD34_009924 [Periophthalmus magnuspinnatus]|nr:hypothetical protein NQD34_009924 [Periophthalmus magnuspinnatus]
MLLLKLKHTLNIFKNKIQNTKKSGALFFSFFLQYIKTIHLCYVLLQWHQTHHYQNIDIINNTNIHAAHSNHHHSNQSVLLYMQPKHNYKIKREHFKIKAHYLLERVFWIILHSVYCLLF